MRPLTTTALAIAVAFATTACKKDKSTVPAEEAKTAPPASAEKTPAAGSEVPPASAEKAPAGGSEAPPTSADRTKTATDHTGHRHEPTDPYYCPMDSEETSDKPGTKCPVCQMEMVPRKK